MGKKKTKEKKKKLAAWVKCKNAAEAVLELDPGNREAKRLRDQADNGLGTVDIPRVATPRDTLRGTQGANGVEPFNQEAPKDEWRHQKKGFFDWFPVKASAELGEQKQKEQTR